jgi:hypothetical protein
MLKNTLLKPKNQITDEKPKTILQSLLEEFKN